MRTITIFSCVLALASSVGACSDDGIVPQNADSGAASNTTGDAATQGPNDNTGVGSDGEATTANSEGEGGSTGFPSDTTGFPETTGSGTSGNGTEGTSGTTGDTEGTSTGDESSTGDVCEPLADGGAIGQDCGPGGVMCPPEYTCQPFVGLVLQESCQIICTDDCECPLGMTCNMNVDKTGIPWFQCGF